MPRWLHRTTRQLLHSVPSAELPETVAEYIEEPNLTAVQGQPSKYWVISGDTVSLMPQAARDVVDAALLSASRDSTANQLGRIEDVLRAFALTVLDEINVLRSQHSLSPRTIAQLKNAVRSKLGT